MRQRQVSTAGEASAKLDAETPALLASAAQVRDDLTAEHNTALAEMERRHADRIAGLVAQYDSGTPNVMDGCSTPPRSMW